MQICSVIIGSSGGIGKSIVEILRHKKSIDGRLITISRTCADSDINKSLEELRVSDFTKFATKGLLYNIYFCHRYRGENKLEEYRIHVLEPYRLVKLLLGSGKTIRNVVCLTSTCSDAPVQNQDIYYHATRGAIDSAVKKMAIEFGQYGTRVNGIGLNTIIKDSNIEYIRSNAQIQEFYEHYTPLGRIGTSTDVANACVGLTDETFSFMTGQIINIDGGLSLLNQECFRL